METIDDKRIRSSKFDLFMALGVIILLAVSGAACLDDDDDVEEEDTGDDLTIIINEMNLTISGLFSNQTLVTITDMDGNNFTGISLSDLITLSDVADPATWQYNIAAGDGYNKNVTWEDMKMGVLTEHAEDNTMTAFPHYTGKYRVRNVLTIEPVNTSTLTVNGWLYTWDQPFDKLDEIEVTDNESVSYEGVPLSDLINDTGLVDQHTHNYTITAFDNYSKEFTWDDMMNGVLMMDEHRSVFPDKEKKFWVANIVMIEVV